MTEISTNQPDITRREYLKLMAVAAGTWFLSACRLAPPTLTSLPRPTDRPRIPEGEIIPGEYDEFVTRNNLVATEYKLNDSGEVRIEKAISWLRRFRDALKDHPEMQGQKLSALGINAAGNYPISIPNNSESGNDWNIWEVINTFIEVDVKDNSDTSKTQVVYNPKNQAVSGISHQYLKLNDRWERRSKITFGKKLTSEGYHIDTAGVYTRFTDVEVALLLLHEYAHALQEDMLLTILNNNADGLASIRDDLEKLKAWKNEEHNKIQTRMADKLEKDLPDADKKYAKQTLFHESQANAVGMSALLALNLLNGSEHFPGTRILDPFPEERELLNQQNNNPYDVNIIQNLYELFLSFAKSHKIVF